MNKKVIRLKSHKEERYRRDIGREQDRLGGEETQVWAHLCFVFSSPFVGLPSHLFITFFTPEKGGRKVNKRVT